MKIVFIGSGNVATSLSQDFESGGNMIEQVFSRNASSASSLARIVHAGFISNLKELITDADFYFICVKDDAIADVIEKMPKVNGTVIHTSGSTSIDVFRNKFKSFGVFYPLQSFSKFKKITLKNVPVFIEANDPENENKLKRLTATVTDNIQVINSQQRLALHVCGVFASNFTNHLYSLAFKLSKKYNLPFEVFFPLIEETAEKIKHRSPLTSQTGPAVRKDMEILNKHQDFLKSDMHLLKIYKMLSESIINYSEQK